MVVELDNPVVRAFVKRLNRALDVLEVSERGRPAWLAKGLGVTVQAAQKYFNGLAMPKGSRWKKLATVLHVSISWIRDGVGPMKGAADDPYAQELWDLWPQLDDDTKRDLVGAARVKAKPASEGPFKRPLQDVAIRAKSA